VGVAGDDKTQQKTQTIFVSRRQYRNMPDTKSGKRSEMAACLSWQTACNLGFRGSLEEWERLMGAEPKR
jgi:hypothetical protein